MNQSDSTRNDFRIAIGFLVSKGYTKNIQSYVAATQVHALLNTCVCQQYHITLVPIGNIFASTIPSICDILENTARKFSSMTLKGGKTIIMYPDEPSMLWIRYDSNPWYEKLVAELERVYWKIGTWHHKRDRKGRKSSGSKVHSPHITIARTTEGKIIDSIFPPFDLHEDEKKVTLDTLAIFSVTKNQKGGMEYTPMYAYKLT